MLIPVSINMLAQHFLPQNTDKRHKINLNKDAIRAVIHLTFCYANSDQSHILVIPLIKHPIPHFLLHKSCNKMLNIWWNFSQKPLAAGQVFCFLNICVPWRILWWEFGEDLPLSV